MCRRSSAPQGCPTLLGKGRGNRNSSQTEAGQQCSLGEQHSKILFIATAGVLRQPFLFLFVSWGLGFVLFASYSQRMLWTAFLDPWPVLCVYHHSNCKLRAVPWVLAKISTQGTEINPPKVRGTNCFMDTYIPPTNEVSAWNRPTWNQNPGNSREKRMQDVFPPPCTSLSFKAYITLPGKKKSDSKLIKNLPRLFFFFSPLLAYFCRLLLQQLHLKIPGARPLVYYH